MVLNKEGQLPKWLLNLDEDDFEFIRIFILSSGSLKDISKYYDVSYPTTRLRLDRLIEKIKISEDIHEDDSLIALIKYMAMDDKIDIDSAKLLIDTYRKGK